MTLESSVSQSIGLIICSKISNFCIFSVHPVVSLPKHLNAFNREFKVMRNILISVFILISLPVSVTAFELPRRQSTPGGVAIIELGTANTPRPTVRFNKKKVLTIRNRGKWVALVGIPLSTKPGVQKIEVKANESNNWQDKNFTVKSKHYTEQRLTIKNKRKVDPNEEDMLKIRADRVLIANAKKHWSEETLATKFKLPVLGRLSSEFGLKRFFNGKPRRPHGGLDIAASEGTPVYAPADGIVIESENFYFSGNCIFIDHGQGLQTFYAHLSKRDVKPGQAVKKGQKIAEVGQTGRVTGPHLHWSVGLNQTWVDPNLFLE